MNILHIFVLLFTVRFIIYCQVYYLLSGLLFTVRFIIYCHVYYLLSGLLFNVRFIIYCQVYYLLSGLLFTVRFINREWTFNDEFTFFVKFTGFFYLNKLLWQVLWFLKVYFPFCFADRGRVSTYLGRTKGVMKGKLIAVVYTLLTYWNQSSLGGFCKQEQMDQCSFNIRVG